MYDKKVPYNNLPKIPISFDFDTITILKKLNLANKAVASFDSSLAMMVNPMLLISPLSVREAVRSSEIENIFTTVSQVFESSLFPETQTAGQKEVLHYRDALMRGYELSQQKGGLGVNDIIEIQGILEPDKAGIRKLPGTVIASRKGDQINVIYTPPEGYEVILDLLSNLEKGLNSQINDQKWTDIDPLIQFGILHHQFESIHPFNDGNGRTGRILMLLFLVMQKTIAYPVLFLSGYILNNRAKYYEVLNQTTEKGDYTELVMYFLDCVIEQSSESKKTILDIKDHYTEVRTTLKENKLDLYSFEMLDYLFGKPLYTILDMEKITTKHRNTCSKVLNKLVEIGLLEKRKYKRENIYFNPKFLKILS